jgi:hypothetical protein
MVLVYEIITKILFHCFDLQMYKTSCLIICNYVSSVESDNVALQRLI